MGVPVIGLTSHRTTDAGTEFYFTNVMAIWVAPIIILFLFVNLIGQRAPAGWLLVLLLPPLFLKNVWTFQRKGPSVGHEWRLFGRVLWRRTYSLGDTDRASASLIEETWYRINRPRWYRLTLSLSSLLRNPVLMRSTNPEELDRVLQMVNAAIKDTRANAAS
jgi:hypothetical protein